MNGSANGSLVGQLGRKSWRSVIALSAVTMSLFALRWKEGELVARQAQGEMRMVDLRGWERGRAGIEG
jgi:hypothetical protein